MAGQPPPVSFRILRSYAWLVAIIGLLLLVGSGFAYFFNRAWAFESQLGASVGGVLLLSAILMRPDTVHSAITGRSVKYGSFAMVMSLAFIGILGFINFLVLKNDREFDLTETGLFTLSKQTVQLLKNIGQPVQVIGFFQAGDPRLAVARDYLERYSHYTHYLTYEFYDPNVEPALAQSFELNNYGLVFISGDKSYEASRVDEQTLTSGLIRVTDDDPRMLYFITGHGEHSIDDGGEDGYSTLKQALERENYVVSSLSLSASAATVPADATALVLSGADRELLDIETRVVSDWVAAGGKLMILVDPLEPVPLEQVLEKFGLLVDDNFVVEDFNNSLVTLGPKGLTPQLIAPMVVRYPYHEITHGLDGYQSFFPFARSITVVTPPQAMSYSVMPILTTSPGSWAETDLQAAEPEYTEGADYYGPLNIGVAAEDYESEARLVVFGDTGFVTNQNVSPQMANLDVFMNAVNWLAEEEELISIRPKQPENRALFMTSLQISFTFFTTVIVIPLIIFSVGVGIWWKRR